MSARFVTPLVMESEAGEGDGWVLRAPFAYQSDVLDRQINVPEGFRTDLASVPRLPVVYLLAGATGHEAAVVHDFLYATQLCARKQADDVFHEALLAMGVPKWRAWMMWCGVRIGGGAHWKARPEQGG